MIFGIQSIYFWMVMLIVCIVAEASTMHLISIWFAVGALAALIAATLNASVTVQILLFVAVSAILLASLRQIVSRFLKVKGEKTNADRIIGETAIVTEKIDNMNASGQIKLMGQSWTARSVDESIIEVGEKVKICAISGVKAIVEKNNKILED